MWNILEDEYSEHEIASIRNRPVFVHARLIRMVLGSMMAHVKIGDRSIMWLIPGEQNENRNGEPAAAEIASLKHRLDTAVELMDNLKSNKGNWNQRALARGLLVTDVLRGLALPDPDKDVFFTEDGGLVLVRWGLGDPGMTCDGGLTAGNVTRFVDALKRRFGVEQLPDILKPDTRSLRNDALTVQPQKQNVAQRPLEERIWGAEVPSNRVPRVRRMHPIIRFALGLVTGIVVFALGLLTGIVIGLVFESDPEPMKSPDNDSFSLVSAIETFVERANHKDAEAFVKIKDPKRLDALLFYPLSEGPAEDMAGELRALNAAYQFEFQDRHSTKRAEFGIAARLPLSGSNEWNEYEDWYTTTKIRLRAIREGQ